jgi:predicted RNA polymerase sigma factor
VLAQQDRSLWNAGQIAEGSELVERALYEGLMRIANNPVVALNHAVAVAMARGPRAGLTLLDKLQADARIADDPRMLAVRAHLLERAGDREAARGSYEAAARRTHSLPRQRYLNKQAARLASDRQ